jgi:putative addiction module component (TIGR02574 family)
MTNDLSEESQNDTMRSPDEQRAALAAALIESLDRDVDADAEAAWSVEIARRLRDVESGRVKTIPWPQTCQLIAADEQPDAIAHVKRRPLALSAEVIVQGRLLCR